MSPLKPQAEPRSRQPDKSAKPLAEPLDAIADWASRIRQGHFSARVSLADACFAGVEDDINRLAEWLQSLALERESELKTQSAKIDEQSRALELVYTFTEGLNKTYDVTAFISNYLPAMKQVSGAIAAEAYLFALDGEEMLLSTLADEGVAGGRLDEVAENCLVVPISYKDKISGEFRLNMGKPVGDIPAETRALLANIGLNLGMALEKSRKDRETVRLGRMEERTRLAHELHDSLAQTLASLRFQVRTLDSIMQAGQESESFMQLEKVETLLDGAHDELRSLIGQFRAPIESGGLAAGFKTILNRFRTEAGIPVFFHNQWDEVELPEETEVNIIRIAQEALKNICKHAEADAVRILMRKTSSGRYQMIIEDDGVGLAREIEAENNAPGEHIGLSVMRERAAMIDGEFSIESEPGGGTRILLSFAPE